MNEQALVDSVVNALEAKGFNVATEVPNSYRSADICAIDNKGDIWIIECKISSIGRAIEQSKTHMISADKVFIATFYKKTQEMTLKKIRAAGIGLFYVMPDGSLSKPIEKPTHNKPWKLSRNSLLKKIKGTD